MVAHTAIKIKNKTTPDQNNSMHKVWKLFVKRSFQREPFQ